jgi:hypothetical protein
MELHEKVPLGFGKYLGAKILFKIARTFFSFLSDDNMCLFQVSEVEGVKIANKNSLLTNGLDMRDTSNEHVHLQLSQPQHDHETHSKAIQLNYFSFIA